MNTTEKAESLIETFYQAAPEILGTGRARMLGIQMAKILVEEIVKNKDSDIEWEKVNEYLESQKPIHE